MIAPDDLRELLDRLAFASEALQLGEVAMARAVLQDVLDDLEEWERAA